MIEHTNRVRELYDGREEHGPYGTLAPDDKGGRKSRYVAAVFDAALKPLLMRSAGPLRLLDYGCGTGIFSLRMQACAQLVAGIDISHPMLKIAQQMMQQQSRPVVLAMTDGIRLPFGDGAFNCGVARETLCHVADADMPAILAELKRVIVPGGRFYLLDQVSESPRWQSDPRAPLVKKRPVAEITALFANAGFDLQQAFAVRQPRFPWIYPIQFGIVPGFLFRPLAWLEVCWNKLFCPLHTRRWQDALFVFEKK